MSQAITLTKTQYGTLVDRLDKLEALMSTVMAKLDTVLTGEPVYGSEEWWDWATKEGLKDIENGRYTTIHNEIELKEFFDKL